MNLLDTNVSITFLENRFSQRDIDVVALDSSSQEREARLRRSREIEYQWVFARQCKFCTHICTVAAEDEAYRTGRTRVIHAIGLADHERRRTSRTDTTAYTKASLRMHVQAPRPLGRCLVARSYAPCTYSTRSLRRVTSSGDTIQVTAVRVKPASPTQLRRSRELSELGEDPNQKFFATLDVQLAVDAP